MLTQIIKNDWRSLTADRGVWIVLSLFIILAGYALYNGIVWTQSLEGHTRSLTAKQEQGFAESKDRIMQGDTKPVSGQSTDPTDPFNPAAEMVHAILPAAPLAFTSIGQSDLLRPNAGVSILSKQRTEDDKQGFENPLSFLAGRFDFAFVAIYLLPLLILALCFNLLSSERENGTLQMVLSQPVSLRSFAIVKLLHRFVIVLVLTLGVLTISIFFSGTNTGGTMFWPGLGLLFLAIATYTLFWFSLTLFINSFNLSSATNAVVLAGCWIAVVLVVPSVINAVITTIYPMPSRTDEISAIRKVKFDIRRDGSQIVSEFYQDHPELAPQNSVDGKTVTLAFATTQQWLKNGLNEVEDNFDSQVARQQSVVDRARFVSPAIAMQETLNDVAGTGVSRHRDFRAQARDFARKWDEHFLPIIFRNIKLTATDYDQIPRFHFTEQSAGVLVRSVLPGLAGIFVLTVILAAFAAMRLGRSRVLQ